MQQELGHLGFAAIALDWERPFLDPSMPGQRLYVQGKAGLPLVIPTVLALDRLDNGDRLQRPVL